jgi:putative holliday junction resolvase
MRILGIDYGTKRIGLAISDENNKLAFPKEIISNNANTFKRIGEIITKDNISEIVVGESFDFKGALNAVGKKIEIFILELQEKFTLPVHKQKEFLTSVEARKSESGGKRVNLPQSHTRIINKKKGRVDASAAALILQRYLDKRSKHL